MLLYQNKNVKVDGLLGEVIQLFDTKGQEIREKQADAQLGAIELAKLQLTQGSSVPTWVYILIPIVVIGIGVAIYFAVKK